ncbi:toxin-antitoxin system YwqK family antitoxin [Paraglaciecola hydrolytica]|nr:toxin-antitoxin system YwqK family antitoxin [Paraglaciecola hydrolytica]
MRSVNNIVVLTLLLNIGQTMLLIMATNLGMLTFVSAAMADAEPLLNLQANQAVVPSSEISIAANTGLRMYQGSPFSGQSVEYYPSGQLAKLESFKLGLRHGKLKQWFSHGVLAFDSQYLDGQLEGPTTSWWSNGNLRSITPYVAGKVHGVTEQWYASGEVFKKMHYLEGQEEGLQQAWRRNGKLYSNYEYKNGRVYGLKRANMCVGLENEKISLAD